MKKQKFLAVLLAVLMLLSVLPVMAFAGEDDTSVSTDNDGYLVTKAVNEDMTLRKKATLEDDGTYTINLEAWATGNPVYATVNTGLASDIILVLDQSGSMVWDDSGEDPKSESDTRYASLKDALRGFIDQIWENAKEYNVDHRVSMIGFANDSDSSGSSHGFTSVTKGSVANGQAYCNTGIYINGQMKNYSSSLTNNQYYSSLISAYDKTTGTENALFETSISNMGFQGGTYTEYGLQMAQKVFDSLDAKDDNTFVDPVTGETKDRQRVVVVFTDGESDSSTSTILSYGNKLKNDYNATVYTISLLDAYNEMLDSLSSNESTYTPVYNISTSNTYYVLVNGTYYEVYSSWSGKWYYVSGWNIQEVTPKKSESGSGTQFYTKSASGDYYKNVTSASDLSDIFKTFSETITAPGTDAAMDETTIMRDVLTDNLVLPETAQITIQKQAGTADSDNVITWGEKTALSTDDMVTTYDTKTGTVEITGFDYCENYITSGKDGYKLIVTIKGVTASESAVNDIAVDTNTNKSGIWYKDPETEWNYSILFGVPNTYLPSASYVMDYAKSMTLNASDMKLGTAVNVDADGYDGFDKNSPVTGITEDYGKVSVNSGAITYTPTTTNWNGYDTFYVFGTTTDTTVKGATANTNGNVWSKVNVIPANNVYYEDTFVDSESAGIVGIEYTGSWTQGTATAEKETAEGAENADNGGVQGWEDALANDTGDSDGSVYEAVASSTNVAKATFTFTGTGVDIYSRTTPATGTILVTLKGTVDGTTISKAMSIDTVSVSDTYYNVPTASIYEYKNSSGETVALPYGEYTVTIYVTTAAASENRYTFYLDGIRVYNPIQNQESDEVVKNAYGTAELNASFVEVRDMLLDASSFTAGDESASGIVFIDVLREDDKLASGDQVGQPTVTASLATYKTYGPENSVYLAKNQAITFAVNYTGVEHYYVSLQATSGDATTAVLNGSKTDIGHTSDLYYEVTPKYDEASGKYLITIANEGAATDGVNDLLSVNKLKVTGAGAEASTASLLADVPVSYALAYTADVYSLAAYDDTIEPETPEEDTPVETPEEETPEVETPDVEIENPEENPTEGEQNFGPALDFLRKLFSKIRGWFKP